MLDQNILSAVSSPRRREILRLIWKEERSAGDIHREMPDVTFGAVSLQLRSLANAGLVEVRRDRTFRYYRAKQDMLAPVAQLLEQMWSDSLWRLKLLAELEASRRGPQPKGNTQ